MLDPVLDKGGPRDGQDLSLGNSCGRAGETKQVTITYNLAKVVQKARRGTPTHLRRQGFP